VIHRNLVCSVPLEVTTPLDGEATRRAVGLFDGVAVISEVCFKRLAAYLPIYRHHAVTYVAGPANYLRRVVP
jgi:hypothetical protein